MLFHFNTLLIVFLLKLIKFLLGFALWVLILFQFLHFGSQLIREFIFLLFHSDLQIRNFSFLFVIEFFKLINQFILIFNLFFKMWCLLFVLIQKFFLTVFELDWNFFLSFIWVFKSLLEEFNLLFKESLLLIKFRFRSNLLSLNILFVVLSLGHFLRQFFNLPFEFFLLLSNSTV